MAPTGPRLDFLPPEQVLRMDDGTFMWVNVRQFSFGSTLVDGQVFTALLNTPWYRDLTGTVQEHPDWMSHVHGPYHLQRMSPMNFRASTPADAAATIEFWANNFDDAEDDAEGWEPYLQSEETMALVATLIYPLFDQGVVYELAGLTDSDRCDDYGYHFTFHEFVVLDRHSNKAIVVIATDD